MRCWQICRHDFHHLHEVHLIVIRGLASVLPDRKSAPVGQPLVGTKPVREVVGSTLCAYLEEMAQLVIVMQYSVSLVIEYGLHERALEHGVLGAEGEQTSSVNCLGKLVPLPMD